ncbi:MAG: cob(I)yrinic acid a,c-diamide adenosyltransferase [Bacteroidetes bacterium]|jgi:cob(I)alamin adenosyltransferase|nr:cob(I)yrinic acid a,c-diamide adenosyltransferase [Bacteroidota bacterium]MBK7568895.1 cob(I)yrinic acid a,c-diamide adenosyltransferase [Bacteroidota bacterium]
MKIYTKKGDTGETSLIGGTRVPKHHLRVEAYGSTDELNVYIGLIADQKIDTSYKNVLSEIQDILFTIGASLASDPERSKMKIPDLKEEDITLLENEIDAMEEKLPELQNFILPGGHTIVSFCHLARVVCRRTERIATHLAETDFVAPLVIPYLNRLSDYLFVLSRKLAKDLEVDEIPWKPRGN